MKAFISYSPKNRKFAKKLADALVASEISIWIDVIELHPGDNLFEHMQQGLQECDFIIPVLSSSYVGSRWAMQELNAFFMKEIAQESNSIFPVLLEDCDIPIFLRDKIYIDFRGDFSTAIRLLLEELLKNKPPRRREAVPAELAENRKHFSQEYQISTLREHLRNGELTLVCGAGVSVAAGVPAWATLLEELLTSLFGKKLPGESRASKMHLAALYQNYFNSSSLVVAQYLKNGLGNDFLPTVRRVLYRNSPCTNGIIDAIVALCRPQRSRESLNSIITFNFDDLIENNLREHHIKCKAIFSEGHKASRFELPIFHVHGYLPRDGEITAQHEVVFSEDAYHSQFIDPFSWSNLVQLSHFGQKVCVFIGLSMTDPNLRRLLDVAMRKNPERKANHYVFKRKFDPMELQQKIAELGMEGDDASNVQDFIKISELLEEQDSSNLGLNTIWIDNYSEIPGILHAVAGG